MGAPEVIPPPPPVAAAAAAPEARAPDWETMTREVVCPLCGYNLRGLVEPRCPECGYAFEWSPMLSQCSDARHRYLFEHQPRRNIASFARTLRESLFRPAR